MSPPNLKPIKFVNRKNEIEIVLEQLQRIKSRRPVFNMALSVAGIPGIGKTTLLKRLEEKAEIMGFDVVLVDFAAADEHQEILPVTEIARQFLGADITTGKRNDNPLAPLQDRFNEYLKISDKDKQSAPDEAEQIVSKNNLLRQLVKNLRTVLKQRPLLLLVDNSHLITERAQEVLETILQGVYDLNRLFMVICGRTYFRWDSFELRRRTRATMLEFFKADDAALLFNRPTNKLLTTQAYRLTNGYPLAGAILDELLSNRPESVDITSDKSLIFDLVDAILKDYLLNGITPDERQQIEEQLKFVSPLRRFDDEILAALWPAVHNRQFGKTGQLAMHRYTRQLAAKTYLVKWDSAKHAYTLDYPIRHLLALELFYREREYFLKIHQAAAEWYGEGSKESLQQNFYSAQSILYLIEHIYHRAQYQRAREEDVSKLKTEFEDTIRAQFNKYAPREKNSFYEEFKQDKELRDALDKLYAPLFSFVQELS